MDRIGIRHIAIVIQSFAIAVAFSILLGRIYLLTYYRNLGIPISEIRLSAIDYSVVSANVTVLAVGFAVVSAANLWWSNSVTFTLLSGKWQQILGTLLTIAGVALVHVSVSNPTQQLDHGSVSFGLLVTIALALLSFGGSLLGSGATSDTRARGAIAETISKVARPGLSFLLIIYTVWIGSLFATKVGELNAENTLQGATHARVELSPPSATDERDFKVILVSDKFVYLRPVDTESTRKEVPLHAIPTGNVVSITYSGSE